MNNEQ
jgi:hypothetical protein